MKITTDGRCTAVSLCDLSCCNSMGADCACDEAYNSSEVSRQDEGAEAPS